MIVFAGALLLAVVGLASVLLMSGDERAVVAPSGTTTDGTATTVGTSTAPVTAAPPATVAAAPEAASSPLELAPDGLGIVGFGEDGPSVVAKLRERLGPPDQQDTAPACPSGVARIVEWADLAILLGATGSGGEELQGWSFGPPSAKGKVSLRLRTREGATLGSTVAELRGMYQHRLHVLPAGSQGSPYGPSFYVDVASGGYFGGALSGTKDRDTVSGMEAGQVCGG